MSRALRLSSCCLLWLLAGMAAPVPASAAVEVSEGAHGRTVITNESDAQRSRRLSPRLVTPPDRTVLELIVEHSELYGLDPALVRAVVQAESGYNVRAVSRRGAQGLMQLMPATAVELAVDDPFDPRENVRGGATYLRRMLDRFDGWVELALAAYNAGPGAVERFAGIPPYRETLDYVERVLVLWREGGGDVPQGLAIRPSPGPGRAPGAASAPRWTEGGERILLTNDPQAADRRRQRKDEDRHPER